jgi:hypothetical protein
VSVQPDCDPKKADRYHSFRLGFRDAINGRPVDPRAADRPDRPDIARAYKNGREKGEAAFSRALRSAQLKYGFTPGVLRAPPPGRAR